MTENPKQKEKRDIRDKKICMLWPELSMAEIGKEHNLSKARISQIIKKRGVGESE